MSRRRKQAYALSHESYWFTLPCNTKSIQDVGAATTHLGSCGELERESLARPATPLSLLSGRPQQYVDLSERFRGERGEQQVLGTRACESKQHRRACELATKESLVGTVRQLFIH